MQYIRTIQDVAGKYRAIVTSDDGLQSYNLKFNHNPSEQEIQAAYDAMIAALEGE